MSQTLQSPQEATLSCLTSGTLVPQTSWPAFLQSTRVIHNLDEESILTDRLASHHSIRHGNPLLTLPLCQPCAPCTLEHARLVFS